jgi:hypothetical protein
VKVAEDGERRLIERIDQSQRLLDVARTDLAPGAQQYGGEVALLAGDARAQFFPGCGIAFELEVAHAERQSRRTVVRVARQHFLRQNEAFDHVAIGQRRDKGALDQIDILRIGAKALAEKRRGGERIMLELGDPGGQIIAGGAFADLEGRGNVEGFARLGGGSDKTKAQGKARDEKGGAFFQLSRFKRHVFDFPGCAACLDAPSEVLDDEDGVFGRQEQGAGRK